VYVTSFASTISYTIGCLPQNVKYWTKYGVNASLDEKMSKRYTCDAWYKVL